MAHGPFENPAVQAMRDAQAMMRDTQAAAAAGFKAFNLQSSEARAREQRAVQTEHLGSLSVHGEEQAQALAAIGTAGREQAETLTALRKFSEELASERRRSAARENIQQTFNKRMSWAAVLLAGAAVVVPFAILLIEQSVK